MCSSSDLLAMPFYSKMVIHTVFILLYVHHWTANGLLLGPELTHCSPSLLGNTWQETLSEGCKVCHCVMIDGDVFQECETPMRPTAWPVECERVRNGCNYTIVHTSNPEITCPGWSYTSYKYLIRMTGFDWEPKINTGTGPVLKPKAEEQVNHPASSFKAMPHRKILNGGGFPAVRLQTLQSKIQKSRKSKRN